MTYGTIAGDLPLDVAGDTETHSVDVVHFEDLRHSLHVPVTRSTRIGTERLDMPLMREVCMPGEIMHSHPLDWLLLCPRLSHLLDLRLVGTVTSADHQVTPHAGLD